MGSFNATVAADFLVVDGVEPITYTATRPAPGNARTTTTTTVNNADPHDYSAKEIGASNGFFQYGDRQWGIGRAQLPVGLKPQRGDTIVEADGSTWEVIDGSALDSFGISWFVPSRLSR